MAKETDEKKYSREQLRERMTCVIIATYNNEKTLEDVVRGCMEWCDDVIVVNDGSTDRTSEILKRIEGITKIEYVKNKGKGYALKKGFKKAQEMGMAYAITLDSDGQHKPDDIKTMMQASKKHPGSLILGARKMDGRERTKGS